MPSTVAGYRLTRGDLVNGATDGLSWQTRWPGMLKDVEIIQGTMLCRAGAYAGGHRWGQEDLAAAHTAYPDQQVA